MTKKGVIAILP